MAFSRFGALTVTPAAATFMWVPVVSWLGMTQPIWSTCSDRPSTVSALARAK